MSPKVTIVVPIYNTGNYLKKCLGSILNQTFKSIEIILINDGSTDNSAMICHEYKEIDNRIRVINTSNQGTGEARNIGIDEAKGDYIYFCDPDDWIESNLIRDNYELATSHNADMVIFGVNNYMYNKVKHKYIYTGRRVTNGDLDVDFIGRFPELFEKGLVSAVWNKLYKLSFLKRHNCRFPRYSQGQDFSFNLLVYRDLTNFACNRNPYYNYVKYISNTAVTRYNKDKPYIRKRLCAEFSELLDYWGKKESLYEELLYKFTLNEVISELRNYFHPDSPDRLNIKYKKCKKLLNNHEDLKIIKYTENKKVNISKRILIFFIKHKFTIGIMIESYARQIFRSNFKSVFYEMKNLIRKSNRFV